MVALAGVLLGTALGVGPGGVPAGATIGDPPTVVAVPIDDPAVLGFGLVPSVRRVFVVGADETFVVDETGAVVGTVAIGGDVIEQGNDEMVVLSVDDATITVIDIATLAPITYDLDGYDRLAGLAVANDVAWTSVLASDGTTTLLEIDLLTGATDEVATGLGAAPLQLFTLDFTGDV
ncbi:MAG TPA: hypothetical protein VGO60_02570, partial [Iamia sp.]|nr:hypothetical protein [Iamia sp.]